MPRPKSNDVPKLRHHKASGQAGVVLDGRFLYLGEFGTTEARERYDRVIAEWLQRGRQSTPNDAAATVRADRAVAAVNAISDAPPVSVNEICLAYLT